MASNRVRELSDMSQRDLEDELEKTQKDLLNVRFQYATHQNTNYGRIPVLKREVARIKTVLRERELEEMHS